MKASTMKPGRIILLFAALAVAPVSLTFMGVDATLLWEPGMLLFVGGLPWLLAALSMGPGRVTAAVRGLFGTEHEDRPPEERELEGQTLREIGGLTLAIGAVLFLLELLTLLNLVTATAGNASPFEVLSRMGSAMLGPIYGILLKALVYDPLASAAEPTPGELAAEL